MINNINKLTLKTILTSIIAIGGLVSPAIAQSNPTIVENSATTDSSGMIANNKQQKDIFRCELGENNFYQTIAYTRNGRTISLITWKGITNQASGYSPQQRCSSVTYRFQRFSDAGKLQYVSTGTQNKQPIICVSTSGGVCESNGLLLTLDHNIDKPEQVLKELFDVASRVDGDDFVRANEPIDITQLLHGSSK